MHQLIVIGNGFDLQCGLPSRFSDFQRYRANRVSSLGVLLQQERGAEQDDGEREKKVSGKDLYKEGATIWEVLLACRDSSLWRDIEGAIRNFLVESSNPFERKLSPRLLLSLRSEPMEHERASQLSRLGEAGPLIYDFLEAYLTDQELQVIDIHKVLAFLLDQLHNLEAEFGEYLGGCCRQDYRYALNASDLIEGLSLSELPREQGDSIETSVLDFNYTDPLSRYTSEHDNFHLVNIHGNVNRPVFGIDGKDLMSDPDLVQFTKTYRILVFKNREQTRIIHTASVDHAEPTELIKFYGHSLGEADYSYFQAIFDGVDLYSSNARLIFYYNIWSESPGNWCSEETAQADMFQKVTRLMNEYGKTITNKDHGKNLMHKLLLEGRLTIKRYNY
ncbi:AbiH family protein [Bifidobacterium tibiigranuli]|uniref:Bacteriophage abortive infection AbiH n=1 Tax=Bifidobacterium tibiigranuli TaxID=2172043 RepID=A0A5N6S0E3_9BIFI|nr:AbiH family protein [Bifidobacterium tibiigranuli]KAE8127279.1 hypothetical protein DDF78_08635 [Bifidobacterium tibiigranuli]KAE8129670.1 hypothetical protein DDE84_02415 [Bifidobacterium tibiigranuli]